MRRAPFLILAAAVTPAAANPAVEVKLDALSGGACGGALSLHLGAAAAVPTDVAITVNGTTSTVAAKKTPKTSTVSAGTLDCSKPLQLTAKATLPGGKEVTTKTFAPKSFTFEQAAATYSEATLVVSVTDGGCGTPLSGWAAYQGKGNVSVTIMVDRESIEVTAGAAKTQWTSTTAVDCTKAMPSVGFKVVGKTAPTNATAKLLLVSW